MLQKGYRFSVQYQLPLFLGLALAFSAGIAAVAAAGNEDMAFLTVFTPSLLAIVLTAVLSGRVGLSDLLVKRFWGNPRWIWAAISCGLVPITAFLAILIASFWGGPAPALRTTQLLPQIIVIILISLGEEFGWRGYALPRLQQRYSPLIASLILGVFWAVWHIPGYLNLFDIFLWVLVLGLAACGSLPVEIMPVAAQDVPVTLTKKTVTFVIGYRIAGAESISIGTRFDDCRIPRRSTNLSPRG